MGQEICPVCNGSGLVVDEAKGDAVTCQNCKGDGFITTRG